MNTLDYDFLACEMVLKTFDGVPGGFVSFEQLIRVVHPADEDEVYSFLVDEGLLKKTADGFQITRKGRIVIHSGGIKARFLRDRRVYICSVVAAVAGFIAAVASIVALFM